jgi:hypothetical protein
MPRISPQSLAEFADRFDGVRRLGMGFMARCPKHNDSNPSLSIGLGTTGKVVLNCHAGCDTQEILEAVGLTFADLRLGAREAIEWVEYDYRDEKKKLLHQVVRKPGKEFQQRRPDGVGGWIRNLDGVRRVLYRLPELRAASHKRFVFVVEGEKDADRLAKLDFVVTTNSGGAQAKWLPDYSEALRGRRVVLVPDNDDSGREHVRKIAKALRGIATSVRILELPGVPPKGDVSDWLDSGGTKSQLLALVKATPRQPTRHPTPDDSGLSAHPTSTRQVDAELSTSGGLSPAPTFPVDAFPEPLQKCIHSVAEALPAPPDYFGAMMLAVMSALIGRKRSVQIKDGWSEFPLLWVVVVARSGDRKTPAFEKALEPVRAIQKRLKSDYIKQLKLFENADEESDVESPKLVQLLTTDSTIEALKDVLAGNPNGILFAVDELAGWARSMSQYKGGRGDDRQYWLSIWSSVQVIVNRKANGTQPLIIDEPFVSVTGGIQPDALPALVDEACEDGFAARLLLAYPDPPPPAKWNENTVATAEYVRVCEALWSLKPNDEPITLSSAAKSRWVKWVNSHREETPPDNLRATWSKCEGHSLRIALVLFLSRIACRATKVAELDVESVEGAIKLIDYFKANARRAYGRLAHQADNTRIGNCLKWIAKRGGKVTVRDVYRYELAGVKDAAAAKKLLEELADLEFGKLSEGRQAGSWKFTLNTTEEDE